MAEESNFNVFEYVTYKTFTETIRFTKLFGPYFDIEFDYGSWAEYEDDETGETVVYGINDTYCKIIDYHGESDFTGKIKMILYSDNDTSLIETYESNVTIPNNAHDYYIIENDSLYFDTEPNPGETDIYCIFELYDSNNNLIWSDYYSWWYIKIIVNCTVIVGNYGDIDAINLNASNGDIIILKSDTNIGIATGNTV